jgi:hypothetical protein
MSGQRTVNIAILKRRRPGKANAGRNALPAAMLSMPRTAASPSPAGPAAFHWLLSTALGLRGVGANNVDV